MKITTIVGARPQFVKTAALSEQLRLLGAEEMIVHTGQHFDRNMSELFFDELGIKKPDFNLGVNNLPHGAMTGRMLEGIERILMDVKPDCVVVYGDTDSTLAGALAARKLNIRLAHVEAGLRSFNNAMAEEINRIVTDRISDLLFCPNQKAADNLLKEGIQPGKIIVSGDVMKDSLMKFAPGMRKPDIELPGKYVLCTFHRAENINNPERLSNIVAALHEIGRTVPLICPLHPHTRKKLTDSGINIKNSNIVFIQPAGYLEMLFLLSHCSLVLTDSGGLQKEAYMLGKFCVTLRDETEWTELVENGHNTLAGSDTGKIVDCSLRNLGKTIDNTDSLYGSGNAASIIAEKILEDYKSRQ